jgi:hypothetical protein
MEEGSDGIGQELRQEIERRVMRWNEVTET